MSKYKAMIKALLVTAYNVPEGEVDKLLTNKTDEELTDQDVTDITESLKQKHRDVITSLNKTHNLALEKRGKEKFSEGERRKAEMIEALLRDKFGVDSDKTGEELIDEVVAEANKKTGSKGSDKITDDDIKKHPFYINREKQLKTEIANAKKEGETAVNTLKAEYDKKDRFAQVSAKAIEIFEAMNPVLSDDPKKAKAQKDLLLERLNGFEYQINEGDDMPIPLKDGKRVANDHAVDMDLKMLVENVATPIFDFRVAEERNAPNGAEGGAAGKNGKPGNNPPAGSYKGKLPKNEAEWKSMMADDNLSIQDRTSINNYWMTQAEKQPA